MLISRRVRYNGSVYVGPRPIVSLPVLSADDTDEACVTCCLVLKSSGEHLPTDHTSKRLKSAQTLRMKAKYEPPILPV